MEIACACVCVCQERCQHDAGAAATAAMAQKWLVWRPTGHGGIDKHRVSLLRCLVLRLRMRMMS
jgi:hypothetical protein